MKGKIRKAKRSLLYRCRFILLLTPPYTLYYCGYIEILKKFSFMSSKKKRFFLQSLAERIKMTQWYIEKNQERLKSRLLSFYPLESSLVCRYVTAPLKRFPTEEIDKKIGAAAFYPPFLNIGI